MEGFGVTSAFWALSGLAVVSALGIMLSRSLLHAVLWLILTFIALAGLFVTLSADFVAVAQVLVYAGAVGVLVIFAIMLTPGSATGNAETRFFGAGLLVSSVISGIMVFVAARTDWSTAERGEFVTTAQQIGEALTNRYVLPFEVASVLLIAAMVGAIVLVRPDRNVVELPDGDEPAEAQEPGSAMTAPTVAHQDSNVRAGVV